MAELVSADEAVRRIPDGATVLINPLPCEEIFPAFRRLFEQTGRPRDLTAVWAAGLGPFSEERRGMNHFAEPGMVKRIVAGHIGLNYLLVKHIVANDIEAYNIPQGVLTQLYREIAAKRPGLVTRTGLGTFVDPRVEGGKMNPRTRQCEDLVRVIEIEGEEFLFYPSFHVDVGIVRGTTADPHGNLTGEDEALTMENLEVAMAAKNSGGFVIAQVLRTSDQPANPLHVTVPGIFVDYVVKAGSRKTHPHTLFVEHDPAYTGKVRKPLQDIAAPMPFGPEKIICRRAALELREGMNVNLGIGVPMGVAAVAFEEGFLDRIVLNTEVGTIGGLPEGGKNFGPAKSPMAFMSQSMMFDFYDGGGLSLSCVGMAQADLEGNVNVSRLGPKLIGSGGFINITQAARKCVFCGEFTAGGLDVAVESGRLVIRNEGAIPKFVEAVEQITFSGKLARKGHRPTLFVTERCVFTLVPEGLMLTEIAPGVDVERDILARMRFRPILPETVAPMDPDIFVDKPFRLIDKVCGV